MRGVRKEVERLLQEEFDDPETFHGELADDHLSDYEPSIFNDEADPSAIELDGDGDHEMEMAEQEAETTGALPPKEQLPHPSA